MTTEMDRAHDAFERYERRRLDMDPEAREARPIAYRAFFEGWRAREDVAHKRYANDFAVFVDQMNNVREMEKRTQQFCIDQYMLMERQRQRGDALAEQVIRLGGDPIEAPLYRRISNQRAEIKRLQAIVDAHEQSALGESA